MVIASRLDMVQRDELENLFAALAKIQNIKDRAQFERLLKKKRYSQALLLVCKNSVRDDQLEVVNVLLKYKKMLSLDLNRREKGTSFTLLMLLSVNKNTEIFELLKSHGADPRDGYSEKSSKSPLNVAATIIRKKNGHVMNQERYDQLLKTFEDKRKLPLKSHYEDDLENAKFDVARISFILAAIDYILFLEGLRSNEQLQQGWRAAEIKDFHATALEHCNNLLIKICETIFNLSFSFRERHGKSLSPAPFTWVTFEQLGGSLQFGRQASVTLVPLGSNPEEMDVRARVKFSNEVIATADIVETAQTDIIKFDLPILATFFKQTLLGVLAPQNNPITQIKLPVIKALTAYVRDRFTLVSLMNLINYTDNEMATFKYDKKSQEGLLGFSIFDSGCSQLHQRRFSLETLMGQHAALRRLEKLGEFITGKNFSGSDFDDNTDWQAFITIRDTITHQDERDNQYKVNLLLNDIPRLRKICAKEFLEIDGILNSLLQKRAAVIQHYESDPKKHWDNVLKASKEKYDPKPVAPAIKSIERRTNIENEARFITNMVANSAPEPLIRLAKDVFSGQADRLPPGKVSGEILKYITSNKVDRELNKELKIIWTNALEHGAKTRDERMEKTQQNRDARQNREQQRESKFVGIPEIRALAKDFSAPVKQEMLMNPLKRVITAIEHLNNIQLFLQQVGYFDNPLNTFTPEEWERFQIQNKRPTLNELLIKHHQLRDAIEYNLGQTLQQLDRICELQLARDSHLLHQNLEQLRSFRNYLEHGNVLVDKFAYVDNLIPDHTRIEKYPPVIFQLLFQILPELQHLKEVIVAPPAMML